MSEMNYESWLKLGIKNDWVGNFDSWIKVGLESKWVGPPVCSTHDGLPSTEDEDATWDEGGDPCIHILRLYVDELEAMLVEQNHSPSIWRKAGWEGIASDE